MRFAAGILKLVPCHLDQIAVVQEGVPESAMAHRFYEVTDSQIAGSIRLAAKGWNGIGSDEHLSVDCFCQMNAKEGKPQVGRRIHHRTNDGWSLAAHDKIFTPKRSN